MLVKSIQLQLTEIEFWALDHILQSSDLAMTYEREIVLLREKVNAIAQRLETARKLSERFEER